jgi:competence protein ComEC
MNSVQNTSLFDNLKMRRHGAELMKGMLYMSGGCMKCKIGHHGSSTSTTYPFLREIMPEYAIISCETGNSYGHPHEETLSKLRDADVTLYWTNLQETITYTSDGTTVSFATEKNSAVQTNPMVTSDKAYYIGNINSHVLHSPDCNSLPIEKNRVLFDTLVEALAEGYEKHKTCLQFE